MGVAAQDRMVLVTGLALEGEIKSANRGTLAFDHPELDVVSVDVADIASLVSARFFEVRDAVGGVYRGALEAAGAGQVGVAGADGRQILRIADIVEILVFDEGFLARTNGFLDVGLNVARANSLAAFNVGTLVAYRGPRWGWDARWSSYWQSQVTAAPDGTEFEDSARRISVDATADRYLGRWTIQGTATWEKNDELDLDSRVQAGLLGIYSVVENSAWELSAGGGMVSNTEAYAGGSTNSSAEVVFGSGLDVFDLGNIDVYTLLQSFTNLNEDRYRLKFDGRISWELIDDFIVNFTVSEIFDSAPPVPGAEKRDYRYGFSIGWGWG